MNARRDRVRDPREEILLETNFDDDGSTITRAYNNVQPKIRPNVGRSNRSLDRYSVQDHKEGDCCQSCMVRIPYATVIATLMCLLGVGIFCGTLYRGASLSIIMIDQVFHQRLIWIEAVQIIFVSIGVAMAALALLILFLGFLATGATRYKVYRDFRSRVGGRIATAFLLGLTYILNFVWILMLCFLVIVTFVYTIFWNMCASVEESQTCIDLVQFHFMFPAGTKQEDMRICEKYKIKAFCKDGVENSELMFILATFANFLVVLSLVHYLMCLAANYAHIRDHEKFQELQELQNLQEYEINLSKERF